MNQSPYSQNFNYNLNNINKDSLYERIAQEFDESELSNQASTNETVQTTDNKKKKKRRKNKKKKKKKNGEEQLSNTAGQNQKITKAEVIIS